MPGRATRLARGAAYFLTLALATSHVAKGPEEPDGSAVIYVSATVVSEDARGPGASGAAVAFSNSDCGWDDPPPGATLLCISPIEEGARQRIAVRLVDEEGEPIEAETDHDIRYRTVPISAIADADYLGVSGSVTIESGEVVSSAATFTTLDDALDEFQETFAVKLEHDRETPVDLEFDYVVIPINDNDPEVKVSLDGQDAAEDAGVLSLEVSLNGASGKTVSVDFATMDGTATADADYRPVAGTLTFEPGEVARTVEVGVIDDAVQEPSEWFELVLSNPRNLRLPRFPARMTIQDDDAFLTITGARAAEDSGTLEFVVTATGIRAGGEPATVDYATEDRTATAGADYDPVSGTLAFTAERPEHVVAVPLVDDAIDEPDETLAVVLSNPVNVGLNAEEAQGMIVDDDPLPDLHIRGSSADEGESLGFVVELAGSTARTVTVDYATEDGTATAGTDYVSGGGRLTFAPGESMATIAVETIDNETYEPDETFLARLSSPINAVIVTGEATGTILDDDEEPAAVVVRPENPMLCVGGAPARIDLSRHFSGTNLMYSVSEPDPGVARASLEGALLVLTPVAEGTASVTVTAANMGSRAMFELTITVVADPAELAAIKQGLAVAGGVMLADVVDAISERFAGVDVFARRSPASPGQSAIETRPAAGLFAADRDANRGSFTAWDAWERPRSASPPRTMSLAAGSPASSNPPGATGNWSLWGRGSARRLEGTEALKDGTYAALQTGADARVGEWLLGAAASLARSEADYEFARTVDACGGGAGEGVLETEVASLHPYAGRRVGRGWIWGTAGAGAGEAVVERCTSGQRTSADLSMRMGALGGRHVIAGSERLQVSLVEDVGMVRVKTEAGVGPAAGHDVLAGRARLGLEVSGLCSRGAGVVGWVRGFACHDWGDGVEGSGAEVALGARLHSPARRLRLEAGVHAVAVRAAGDYEELGANVLAAYLPRADGTGLQVSMALRRGTPEETSRLAESWELAPHLRDGRSAMRGHAFLGFGLGVPRGLARPFAAVETSSRGSRVAAGLRYETLRGQSRFASEFSVGRRQGLVEGRFVMAQFEARPW